MSSGNKQLFPDLLLSVSNLVLCWRSLNICFFVPFFFFFFLLVTAILLYAVSLFFTRSNPSSSVSRTTLFLESLWLLQLLSSVDPHYSWLFLCKYRILTLSLMNLSLVFHTLSPIYQDHSVFLPRLPMCLQFLPAWCSLKFNK